MEEKLLKGNPKKFQRKATANLNKSRKNAGGTRGKSRENLGTTFGLPLGSSRSGHARKAKGRRRYRMVYADFAK